MADMREANLLLLSLPLLQLLLTGGAQGQIYCDEPIPGLNITCPPIEVLPDEEVELQT